jgi:hypothetical protein
MFFGYLKARNDDYEFYAMCHGAKPSKSSNTQTIQSLPTEPKSNNLLFDDPANYDTMTQEQKEELTSKMKGMFKQLFDGANITPSNGVGKVQKW